MRSPRTAWRDRVFALLLRLLPASFRNEFGSSMIEDLRDQRSVDLRTITGLLWLACREHAGAVLRDMVHAGRLFRRRPAFTTTLVFTLMAGIGVTTAAFSVVQAVVLQPIPGPESERLVRVFDVSPAPDRRPGGVSNANFVDWKTQVTTLDGLALYNVYTGTLRPADGPMEYLQGLAVSDDFLRMTGLSPLLGRLFAPEDFAAWHAAYAANAGSTPRPTVMILQERTWRSVFGGRPDIVGTSVLFNELPVEIIGVIGDHPLLRTFATSVGNPVAFWTPGGAWASMRRRGRQQSAIGRLAPGSTVEHAQAEFGVVSARLEAAYPEDNTGWSTQVTPLREAVAAQISTQLWLLFGASMCVLLIASLNVARLLATLNESRKSEFLTRLAIGASRAVIIRQAVTEGLSLSVIGGGLGILLAYLLLPLIVATAPGDIPRLGEVTIHRPALLFAVGLTMVVGLGSGVLSRLMTPARLVTAGPAPRRGVGWWRSSLLVLQVAVALTLAVAAILLLRSLQQVDAQPLGFSTERVVAATIAMPRGRMASIEEGVRIAQDLVDAVEAHPSVIAAAVGPRPLGVGSGNAIRRSDGSGDDLSVRVADVSRNYLTVIGATVIEGRGFTPGDEASDAPRVAVLNRQAAMALGWGLDAVGQSVTLDGIDRLVVGVLADVRQSLEEAPLPVIYVPVTHSRTSLSGQLLILTSGPPDNLIPELRAIIAGRQPDVAIHRVQTMDERVRQMKAPRHFLLRLVAGFSLLAVGLAIVGVAGVMAETVAQRVKEVGIRIALGARPVAIVAMFVRRGLGVVVAGAGLGLVLALWLRDTLASFVFGVPTTDLVSYSTAAAVLLIAGVVACYLPARRAASIDPIKVLRTD